MKDGQGVPRDVDVLQRRCAEKGLRFDESDGVTAKIQPSEIRQIIEQTRLYVTEIVLRKIQTLEDMFN